MSARRIPSARGDLVAVGQDAAFRAARRAGRVENARLARGRYRVGAYRPSWRRRLGERVELRHWWLVSGDGPAGHELIKAIERNDREVGLRAVEQMRYLAGAIVRIDRDAGDAKGV